MGMDARGALAALEADGSLTWRCVDGEGRTVSPEEFARLEGDGELADLTFDSRAVAPRTLFVCKGAAFKPAYLADAAARGACAYVAGEPIGGCGLPGIAVDDVRRAMARIACAFFGDPSGRLRVVGITGTKGKTTATFYADAVLRARGGAPSAMLTGVVTDDGMGRAPSHNTTPEAIELQRHLANAVRAGCDAAVMEVSSQGLKYDRTLGTRFEVGVFTNIAEDHISPVEHPTFEDYFASKLRLFSQCACAVVNLETDRRDAVLAAARTAPRLLTYAARAGLGADVFPTRCARAGEGRWDLEVATPSGAFALRFGGLGCFNVSNALAAVAACEALGVDHAAMARGLADVHVPGRMERYDAPDGSLVGIVDYAHNEMSMEALLKCVRAEFPGREVTVVFGATGNRGTHRRPGLGRAAGRNADRIVLTEDDPADVPVAEICAEIGEAIRAQGGDYRVVEDRAEAVHEAFAGARRPAVVVVAGKGAEDSILRAGGLQRCATDAELVCRELGVPFAGYRGLGR